MSAEKVLGRLSTVFGEPRTENPDDYLEEFLRAMDGYDAELLMAACDELIKTATFFPRPGELLTIARRLMADRAARLKRGGPEAERDDFEFVGREDPRFVQALTRARTDAPAYARILEKRGTIKVRKEPDGPRKAQVVATVTDLTRRMTGDRE